MNLAHAGSRKATPPQGSSTGIWAKFLSPRRSSATIRYLRAHAKEHGLDLGRIGALGGSAGEYLVVSLGTSGDVKELEGDERVTGVSSRVQGVCDWFGPSDLLAAYYKGATDQKNSPNSPVTLILAGRSTKAGAGEMGQPGLRRHA